MKKIYEKLNKVKSEIAGVEKSSKNPYYKSNYADLNTHLDTVEPVLKKYKLVLSQPCETNNNGTVVSSVIVDIESGEHVESSIQVPASLTDPQKIIACITYFRRATLNSLLALKSLDDDGNYASGKSDKKAKKKKYNNDDEF